MHWRGDFEIVAQMEESAYFPVLVQLIAAAAIGAIVIIASHIFGQRSAKNRLKDSAYECGMEPVGNPHPRFGVKFYVVAMLFVVFDIEVVFMIPFALAYSEFVMNSLPIIIPVMFFIALLCVGLLYEIRKGALDWGLPKSN